MSDLLKGSKNIGEKAQKIPREKPVKHHDQPFTPEQTIEENLVDASDRGLKPEGPEQWQFNKVIGGPTRPYGGLSGLAGRNKIGSDRLENWPQNKERIDLPSADLQSFEVRRRQDLRPKVSHFDDCFSKDETVNKGLGTEGSIKGSWLEYGLVQSHQNGYKKLKETAPHGFDMSTNSEAGPKENVTFRNRDKEAKQFDEVNKYGLQSAYGRQEFNPDIEDLTGPEEVITKSRELVTDKFIRTGGANEGGYGHGGGRRAHNRGV